MFIENKYIQSTTCGEGIKRKILASGGKMMTVEVEFQKGAIGANHVHPHEQVSYVVKGSFDYHIGKEKCILRKGDSVYVPSNIEHGCVALESNSVLLDVFTPQREDFV
ncbi:Cupin domain-containing protein [Natronincola peptidivorans]|uniref:Cupin domain-containing protein n=1 Tax=Natronincola peptidivorans TaxID=426128 RepID=A0A1I0G6C6_9FIRM|nr:cupin domain-containing protein [Natronincola peptidivorans]SET66307.1 Cupin domain-containing protein [Natronincola peptidivorans]